MRWVGIKRDNASSILSYHELYIQELQVLGHNIVLVEKDRDDLLPQFLLCDAQHTLLDRAVRLQYGDAAVEKSKGFDSNG